VHHSNRWLVLLVAVLAMAFAPAPRPKAPSAKLVEMRRPQGQWEAVSRSRDGQPFEMSPLTRTYLIEGGELVSLSRGRVRARWAVVLDPAKAPGAMDLKHERGPAVLCAYRLSGDALTLCLRTTGADKARPAGLKPRAGVEVMVFLRVKKKP
jgi:uncharacterized protein (TIGR03067 family)